MEFQEKIEKITEYNNYIQHAKEGLQEMKNFFEKASDDRDFFIEVVSVGSFKIPKEEDLADPEKMLESFKDFQSKTSKMKATIPFATLSKICRILEEDVQKGIAEFEEKIKELL